MSFINRHLTVFDTYDEWVSASNKFVRPNVSYLLDKIVVVYWLNIESIWGLTIGGSWSSGVFKLAANPAITGIPSVPDGERLTSLNNFATALANLTEVAGFNISNVTVSDYAFSNNSLLETVFADNAIESDHITSAQYMFSGCSSLQSMELDFPSCKNFAGIFSGCSSLNDIKLVCDSGTNFGASFQGVKMLIEDILNPSDPKYFNFDNAQNVSLLFDKCSTNENLNLDLSAKFPNTISGDSMFSNVKFNLAKPEVHVTGFYSAFAKMFSGATGIDGSNNIQPMHLIEYTLNKDTSLAEEFQNMLLESVIIHENGYKVTSYAGTFKGTKHLLEIPDLPASNATTMYQMFNGAVLDIQDSMNYVNPYTYDLSNCTTIENMFRDTAATENIANDMITSEFFPKFINTDKLVNCNFAFQSASLVTGVWNRPVTDNLVEYGHTFGNQRFITSFDNSVKFNVYKTMNSFIGVGEQLPQESGPTYAFTGAGYTTPIDVYMKKDSNDSNNSINCGGLFSRCTSMTESPTINLWLYPGQSLNTDCVKNKLLSNDAIVNMSSVCIGGLSNNPQITAWKGNFVIVGEDVCKNMFETYPAGAAKIADITFSLVRGGVSLNTLNNLTDATLISFIEALVPVNPANTDTDYAGTGLSSYTAPLIIMLNNAQYTNPAIIPSLGISIQNFWLDLSNDLGGSRSDWGYHVLWMA